MRLTTSLRSTVKAARRRGAPWVRLFDLVRPLASARGRARVLTRLLHGAEVHQLTEYTEADRYPELFAEAAALAPAPKQILSFGCSTGEELEALRHRFPSAQIIGAEINRRSRRLAARRVASDPLSSVVSPHQICGSFDLVFALAVLQREPHKIEEMGVEELTPIYPFARFDAAVSRLCELIEAGGLLCVAHTQYRVEDSSAAARLQPIPTTARPEEGLFGPDGKRLVRASAAAIFRKL